MGGGCLEPQRLQSRQVWDGFPKTEAVQKAVPLLSFVNRLSFYYLSIEKELSGKYIKVIGLGLWLRARYRRMQNVLQPSVNLVDRKFL
jgi:hypothetical protein